MKKIKELIISILIPNVVGAISFFLSKIKENSNTFKQPSFNPPGIVFPIVWFVLYTLMGISSYLIYKDNTTYKRRALLLYAVQLFINGLWSIIFFRFKQFLLAFIVVIILILLTTYMIIEYHKINKTPAYLQVPYLLWLIFAAVLSYSVYTLN